jgi:endonuclease/exonuclease/phosphatase family metal-dependent hydrolase
VGRDDGKRAGEFAPILFRNDRFELLESGYIWLSESPEKPGSVSWDSALTRMATWVKLRDKRNASGAAFVVMNTHFDHIGSTARLESAKLLRARLATLSENGKLPVIFTGDLNCHEEDPPVPELLRGGLTDAYRTCHPARDANEATFHEFKGGTQGRRIDFIFTSRQFRGTSCDIDRANENGRYPSDHFAIISVLQWSAP